MKLSEAIRLGAMLRPQAFGDYVVDNASCAVAGALEVLGCDIDATKAPFEEWEDQYFPGFVSDHTGRVPCPDHDCPVRMVCYLELVKHLNDSHHWTRERIADQVEIWENEIEEREGAAAVPMVGTLPV